MSNKVEYILFDAANTLLHKPKLWVQLDTVFNKHGYSVTLNELKKKHKILSEIIHFPDVTSKLFYWEFNRDLCRLLGIVPSEELLNDIFNNCKYLPWEAFEDTNILKNEKLPLGVLSNFNSGLTKLLKEKLPDVFFSHIIISENEKVAKPEVDFYKRAIDIIDVSPEKILYIGDSVKLDIEPALKVGFKVKLIDRDNFYKNSDYQINSLLNII